MWRFLVRESAFGYFYHKQEKGSLFHFSCWTVTPPGPAPPPALAGESPGPPQPSLLPPQREVISLVLLLRGVPIPLHPPSPLFPRSGQSQQTCHTPFASPPHILHFGLSLDVPMVSQFSVVSHRQAHQLSALSSLLFSVSYLGQEHGPQLGSFPLGIVSLLIFKPLTTFSRASSMICILPACPRPSSITQVFFYQLPSFSVLGSVALLPQLCSPSLCGLHLSIFCGIVASSTQNSGAKCLGWEQVTHQFFLHPGTNCSFCNIFSVRNYSLFFGARVSEFCIYCLLRPIPIQEIFSPCRSHNFSFLTNTAAFH